jgi:cation diffusion facilitator family transporter
MIIHLKGAHCLNSGGAFFIFRSGCAMRWVRDYTPQPEQSQLYTKALWITVVGNVFLAVSKALVAYFSGSVAIYADAANSISDVVYSFMMVVGLWMAQRPPDLSHPQGHSRFEPLVGMLVTFSMAFAGYEAARASLERFISGGRAVELGLPTLVLLFSAAIKAGMFVSIRGIAKKLQSPTLKTTAQDNLSDVLTSTAAFIGVLGSDFLTPLLDPIAGFIVAAWIFRAAFRAGKENLGFLTGAGADEEAREQIVAAAQSVPGVIRVHHTMAEYVGPKLVVDLHINVDGDTPLDTVHEISELVMSKVQALPMVDRAYVHVEPDDVE